MGQVIKTTIAQDTGLTPTQEQAATLLASGVSVTDVANRLEISRAAIYLWQKQITFKCFFNRRCSESRNSLLNGLYGLANEALATIRDSLHSENEQVRLKAAMWITEKIQGIEISEVDVVEAVRDESTYYDHHWSKEATFHKKEYNHRLKELGVKEPDYQSTLK